MFRRMTRERFLSDRELAEFMGAVRNRRHKNQPRDHAFFALLANTGMRPSEALALMPADLHLNESAPWIRVLRLKKKKSTPEFDELPVSEALAGILNTCLTDAARGPNGAVFSLSKRQAERLFHRYAAIAGIPGGRWLYSLRHTAATRIFRVTKDIRVVQRMLGHENPDMSCLYAHVSRIMLREAVLAHGAVV